MNRNPTGDHCPPRKPARSWNEIVLEALEALGGESVGLPELYQNVCEEDPESGSWDLSNGAVEIEIRAALRRLRNADRAVRTGSGVWSIAASATRSSRRGPTSTRSDTT